jgi:hypothetical protein
MLKNSSAIRCGLITAETPVIAHRPSLTTRWLAPSLSDILFAALLMWMMLFTINSDGTLGLLSDSNTGYHIRSGDFILEHRAVPHNDIFSFTKPGDRWFAFEWLTDVLFALLYQAAGMKGLVVAVGTVIAVVYLVLLRHMVWRGANFLAVMVILHFGIGASSIHYLARPHIFTLLLLAISLWLIDADRARPSRYIWALFPIAILWVNLHGGFLALIACLAIVAVGSALEGAWVAARRYALLALACLAATGLNPDGFALHRHSVSFVTEKWIAKLVQEYQPPTFHSTEALYFEVLLFAGVALAVWLLWQKQIASALLILFWAHAGLTSVRHIPIYVLVVAPLLGRQATQLWDHWAAFAKRGSLLSIFNAVAREHTPGLTRTSLWAPALVVALALFRFGLNWPDDFPAGKFPVAMVQHYADRIAAARIFTTDSWADYLTFRNYPRQRIFFDGRSDFFGEEVADEYLQVLNGQYGWDATIERYRVDAALVPTASAIASLLRLAPGWRILAQDSQAVLFDRTY